MSTWAFEETIAGDFDDREPLERLVTFYRANGYEVVDETEDAEPDGGETVSETREQTDDADPRSRTLQRGESGAGWWTSKMYELAAEVTLTRCASPDSPSSDAVRISYEIETSGQYLTESDRRFWTRELDTALSHLESGQGDPRDLRPTEEKRAERMEQSRMRYALWGGAAAFVLVILARTGGCF
jgi:hypothetical protein